MTELEYQQKRNALAMSEAPLEVRAKAIEELDAKYKLSDAIKLAEEQFYSSRADIPKGD